MARIRYGLGRRVGQLPAALPAVLLGAAWTVVVILHERGSFTSIPIRVLLGIPLVLGAVMLLVQVRPPGAVPVLTWMGILAAALYTNFWISNTYVIFGLPALAISAVVARRYPALFLTGALIVSAFYGTAQAFLHVSLAPGADAFLAGLWLGTIWTYLVDRERRRAAPMTGLTLLTLYVLLTFFEVFLSPYGAHVAAQDFRGSVWYMMSFMLLAVAPLTPATIRRAAIGFLGVALAVGGYATFRWIAGQTHQELLNAASQTNNNVIDGRIRLFGSFVGGKELAAWTSAAIPFCLACGLAFRRRIQVLALAACTLCAIAMFGADVRTTLVAVLPAVGLVFLLFQLSRAFPGAHLGTTLGVLFAAGVIGIGAFAYTLGNKPDTAKRYNILLTHPTQDPSFQARLFKWHDALVDISHHPFGQGLGTSGRTQQRFGPYVNISNRDVDSSFLKIALEQGAAVTLLFMFAYVAVIVGVARRALLAESKLDAALAIAASAILVDFAILMFAGTYIEGLPALGIWLFAGLGLAGVTRRDRRDERPALPGLAALMSRFSRLRPLGPPFSPPALAIAGEGPFAITAPAGSVAPLASAASAAPIPPVPRPPAQPSIAEIPAQDDRELATAEAQAPVETSAASPPLAVTPEIRPAVSIVLPFAGGREQAEQAVERLLRLRRSPEDEIILVDNSGTEGVVPSDHRLRIVRAYRESSSYYARNEGSALASNEWLLFLDADCIPQADLIERYFAEPIGDDVGAVIGEVEGVEEQEALVSRYARSRGHLGQEVHWRSAFRPWGVTANLLVRRDAWASVGGFQEGIRSAGDTEFSWRLQDAGWRLDYRPAAMVRHEHRDSIRRLARQAARYGAGRAWIVQRYPDSFPPPVLASRLARCAAGIVVWTFAGQFERAAFKALDAVYIVSEWCAFWLMPNHSQQDRQVQRAQLGVVATSFPSLALPGTDAPGSAVPDTDAIAHVESVGRPVRIDREAAGRLGVHFMEDDGRLDRLRAVLWLLARSPGRTLGALAHGFGGVLAVAPAVCRMRQAGVTSVIGADGNEADAKAALVARLLGTTSR